MKPTTAALPSAGRPRGRAPSPRGRRPRRARCRAPARACRRRAGARRGRLRHRPSGGEEYDQARRWTTLLEQRPRAPTGPRRAARRCTAARWRSCASCARTGCSTSSYARLIAALGVAEAALARAPADRRAVLRRPRRHVRDRQGRAACGSAAGRWIGHGTKIRAHEGEVEIGAKTVIGPGVHDLRLPARLDRPRVHRRRPRDADRLRPRRRGGRAARSGCRASTSATSASATTAGSATARASCAA